MRLKFESKLNNMHSAHRDLETKYKRTRHDLQQALKERDVYHESVNTKIDEIALLKNQITEFESQLGNAKEQIDTMNREIKYKNDQIKEFETKLIKTNDELDLCKYKLQDMHKETTEVKLKADVLVSTNDGLKNEKDHLLIELKETRELQMAYEKRANELMLELTKVTSEFADVKKLMVGSNELLREREERIDKLKKEVA